MVRLIFVNDEGSAEVDLPRDGAVFGRALENELPVMADSVSGIHGQIRWTGGRWVLTDLGSTNGTFVNGNRVQQAPLSNGDMVQFGFVAAQFRVVPSLVKPADAPPDPRMAVLILPGAAPEVMTAEELDARLNAPPPSEPAPGEAPVEAASPDQPTLVAKPAAVAAAAVAGAKRPMKGGKKVFKLKKPGEEASTGLIVAIAIAVLALVAVIFLALGKAKAVPFLFGLLMLAALIIYWQVAKGDMLKGTNNEITLVPSLLGWIAAICACLGSVFSLLSKKQ